MRRDIFARGGQIEFQALGIFIIILFVRLLFVEVRTIHHDPKKHPFIHISRSSTAHIPTIVAPGAKQTNTAGPGIGDSIAVESLEDVAMTNDKPSQAEEDDDEYAVGEVYDDDDDEGALARIERALVAPVHLIGSIPNLRPGHLLHTVEGKDQRSFPKGSTVLLTEMTNDFYRGFIVNQPLPEVERAAARKALRVSNGDDNPAPPKLDHVVFYGNGGPVRTTEERWSIIHDSPHVNQSIPLGESLAVGGDISEILNAENIHIILLYGAAVWIPGQLERELKDALWTLSDEPVTKFEDLIGHCHT